MIYTLDPLQDPRWLALVESCPQASVFHSRAWLAALQRTYGYRVLAYTTSPPQAALRDGLVLCRVSSWLTGRRHVSLPFSDHCEPLAESPDAASALVGSVVHSLGMDTLRSLETRSPHVPDLRGAGPYQSTQSYCFHQLDLRPDPAAIFGNFHKSSTQRKIQRAEREGLAYETGRSPELLDAFWRLFLLTRRRHGVPPQPKAWFRNLIECFGPDLQIRVAFQGRRPVASILTLRHKETLVYKYGASDPQFSNLGGTHLLFWRSIQEAKADGLRLFDLGRTDSDNAGLITFKDRWGAARSNLEYTRYSVSEPSTGRAGTNWLGRAARSSISRLPDHLFSMAGRLLYRHMG